MLGGLSIGWAGREENKGENKEGNAKYHLRCKSMAFGKPSWTKLIRRKILTKISDFFQQ